MVEKKKRGPKKGTTKGKTSSGMVKILQKVFDKLLEERKEIDKKIRVHQKYCKDMGLKLSKRIVKVKGDTGKPKGKPGRKPKVVTPEVKTV